MKYGDTRLQQCLFLSLHSVKCNLLFLKRLQIPLTTALVSSHLQIKKIHLQKNKTFSGTVRDRREKIDLQEMISISVFLKNPVILNAKLKRDEK